MRTRVCVCVWMYYVYTHTHTVTDAHRADARLQMSGAALAVSLRRYWTNSTADPFPGRAQFARVDRPLPKR